MPVCGCGGGCMGVGGGGIVGWLCACMGVMKGLGEGAMLLLLLVVGGWVGGGATVGLGWVVEGSGVGW